MSKKCSKSTEKCNFFCIRANYLESGPKNLKSAYRKTYSSYHINNLAQTLEKKVHTSRIYGFWTNTPILKLNFLLKLIKFDILNITIFRHFYY